MNYLFLFKCFLVGVSAASAVGPIFVLTFNNGALHGFAKGFFTALGAALGDGFLLFLGLMGVLNLLGQSHQYQLIIDLAGGLLLLVFGISMIFAKAVPQDRPALSVDSFFLSIAQTLFSTVLNPITLFFFMFVSAQMLSSHAGGMTTSDVLMGSAMASAGSLVILSMIAYAASRIGGSISVYNLKIISMVTGSIVLCIGAYFCFDAVQMVMKIYAGLPAK